MQDSRPQGLELPTPEDIDETVKKCKSKKNVYASILGYLDMSYMQHIFWIFHICSHQINDRIIDDLGCFLYPKQAKCTVGDTTHKIQNISYITNIILNMFYWSPDDIKNDMKWFFWWSFSTLACFGVNNILCSCSTYWHVHFNMSGCIRKWRRALRNVFICASDAKNIMRVI